MEWFLPSQTYGRTDKDMAKDENKESETEAMSKKS